MTDSHPYGEDVRLYERVRDGEWEVALERRPTE